MNFVTRNLGWILLFLFFVFMLFIISSNKPEKQDITTFMSGTKVTQSGTQLGELDELMKKIDDENIQSTQEKDTEKHKDSDEGESEITEGGVMEKHEKKGGFFSRLFGKKAKDSKTVQKKSQEEDESKREDNAVKSKEMRESEEEKRQDKDASSLTIAKNVLAGNEDNAHVNLLKNTSGNRVSQNSSSLPANFVFPGKNLTTKVGKNYKVGVKSLKLNNRSFTQKLAYMMRGDTLKQLAPANSRGCFLAEITNSQTSSNIGKKGYVCKKWLTNDTTSQNNSDLAVKENKTPAMQHGLKTDASLLKEYVSNEVGTQINVSQMYISEDDVVIEAQNTLEQASLKDADGCMKFIITQSNIINIPGKVITLCQ